MFNKPLCRKCNTHHYNFLRCAEADEYMEDLEKRKEEKVEAETPKVFWAPNENRWEPDQTPMWARKRNQ